jgi:phytoene dehydrogenase-like protein
MTEMQEYDVIIIGAGLSGGLSSGAYLAKAGAKVLMVEANQEAGTHCKTNEFVPGALCTPAAAGFFGGGSPIIPDLGLEEYGIEVLVGPRFCGNVYPDGTNLFFGPPDTDGTIEDIARFSERDAERFVDLFANYTEVLRELNELLIFSIPTPEKLDKGFEEFARCWGYTVEQFRGMNGYELLKQTFENEHVRQMVMPLGDVGASGDMMQKGQGAFAVATVLLVMVAQLRGGNHSMVHALARCYLDHGGTLWRNAPVDKIITEDGVAKGIRFSEKSAMYPGQTVYAKHAVVSNVGARQSLKLIGDEEMKAADSRLHHKMKYWDNSTRASTVTVWALKGFPKWKSAEYNPVINKMHFFYTGNETMEGYINYYIGLKTNDWERTFGKLWEIVIPAAVDPTQMSEDGIITFRIEEILPFWWRDMDGEHIDRWDDMKWELVKRREDILEELAPGFKSQIVDVLAVTPLDLWRANMSAEYGNGIGGSFVGEQFYLDRMPYRMPIKNLYMSNSVWPVSLSWCAPGYNAACCVAEDMGIRDQPWWTNRPIEWFMENLERFAVE